MYRPLLIRSFSSIASSSSAAPSFPSPPSSIKRFGVIGAGQMGTGIALVGALVSKLPVILYDVKQEQLNKSLKFALSLLDKDVEKGKITKEQAAIAKENLKGSTDMNDLSNTDFVVEAASENLDIKKSIFGKLSSIVSPTAIIASNTSSISITKLASSIQCPERFIGMHFMNPVPIMKLVELITGLQTNDATLSTTIALAESMGKTTTRSRDVPGFIANRLLMPYINEAIFALYEGIGNREDIDKTMKLGTNMPMGPLILADFIGLDTCLAIMNVLYQGLGDSKYRPCPLLQSYVDAGWLGKKVGRGFYEYSSTSTLAKAK